MHAVGVSVVHEGGVSVVVVVVQGDVRRAKWRLAADTHLRA